MAGDAIPIERFIYLVLHILAVENNAKKRPPEAAEMSIGEQKSASKRPKHSDI